jgi:type VI secretion system protein
MSSNGVFLNRADTPLGKQARAPLQQGDSLLIGEYEIGVSLHEQALKSVEGNSFDALDDPYARLLDENAGRRMEQGLQDLAAQPSGSAPPVVFSLDDTLPPNLEAEAETPPDALSPPVSASESDHISDLDSCFSQPNLIPEDWQADAQGQAADTLPVQAPAYFDQPPPGVPEATRGEHPPEQIQATAAAAAADPMGLRNALADGLGIARAQLDEVPLPELLENLGRIVRSSVEGAMSVLRARAQMKSEFRMNQTMIRPVENNPLKFSVNTEEALRHIIAPRPNSGYLSPLMAFHEAHADTEAHMLAVMVGMQSALKAVILRFKPEYLEQRLHQSALLDKVPLYRQAKSWELFTQLYSDIANEVEDDFQQLFGRAFSQAYEAQIRRLDALKYSTDESTTSNRN